VNVIIELVCLAATILQLLIFAVIVLSWFPMAPESTLGRVHGVLLRLTEPVLGPIRRALPPVRLGGAALDLSPLVVIIGILVLRFALGC